MTVIFGKLDGFGSRHPGESRDPLSCSQSGFAAMIVPLPFRAASRIAHATSHWIPAFAGTTEVLGTTMPASRPGLPETTAILAAAYASNPSRKIGHSLRMAIRYLPLAAAACEAAAVIVSMVACVLSVVPEALNQAYKVPA
jgi:hypothetical protein